MYRYTYFYRASRCVLQYEIKPFLCNKTHLCTSMPHSMLHSYKVPKRTHISAHINYSQPNYPEETLNFITSLFHRSAVYNVPLPTGTHNITLCFSTQITKLRGVHHY